MNLRLDDNDFCTQPFGHGARLIRSGDHLAPRSRHAESPEDFLRLIFVDLHRPSSEEAGCKSRPHSSVLEFTCSRNYRVYREHMARASERTRVSPQLIPFGNSVVGRIQNSRKQNHVVIPSPDPIGARNPSFSRLSIPERFLTSLGLTGQALLPRAIQRPPRLGLCAGLLCP